MEYKLKSERMTSVFVSNHLSPKVHRLSFTGTVKVDPTGMVTRSEPTTSGLSFPEWVGKHGKPNRLNVTPVGHLLRGKILDRPLTPPLKNGFVSEKKD